MQENLQNYLKVIEIFSLQKLNSSKGPRLIQAESE